jgi:hypothetical protein
MLFAKGDFTQYGINTENPPLSAEAKFIKAEKYSMANGGVK